MKNAFFPLSRNTIVIIVTVIILILLSMFTFFKNKFFAHEIVETREFSCLGIEGYTFTYPIFRGWEHVELDQEKCELRIKDNSDYTILLLQVTVGKGLLFGLSESSKLNPHGVAYVHDSSNNEVRFMMGEKSGTGDVRLKIVSLPMKQQGESGFPIDQFFNTVIDSFRAVEKRAI